MEYRGPILTLVAIAIFGGLITYAVVRGSDNNETPLPTLVQPSRSIQATGVGFVSPLEGDTVTNPITVNLVVGGLRLQKAGEPVTAGFGHLGVVIDGPVPAEGATFTADATHLDLSNGEHAVTLPELTPGAHTLSVVFMNAGNISSGPLLSETIRITVEPGP
jgi:hypothetical protein